MHILRQSLPLLLCFSALLNLESSVSAQSFPPEIEQQIKSGNLTRAEATALYGGQKRMRAQQFTFPAENKASLSIVQPLQPRPQFSNSCQDSTEVKTQARPYRCCELPTQDAVLAAFEEGNYYLDHDSDGYACEKYKRTYVGLIGVAEQCLDVLNNDVNYHLHSNYDDTLGADRRNLQPLPNGSVQNQKQMLRGQVNGRLGGYGMSLQGHLNEAIDKTLASTSEVCARSTGLLLFSASKLGKSFRASVNWQRLP